MIESFCSLQCAAKVGCVDEPVRLAPGASVDEFWSGYTYTMEPDNGCSCRRQQLARGGQYRVTIPVYDGARAVREHAPAYYVSGDFVQPGGAVDLPIAQ
jgi:hypothetical protein